MILIIDPQHNGARLGRLTGKKITWRSCATKDRIFTVLKKVMDGTTRRIIKGVVVCGDVSHEASKKRNVSWSGLRTTVAIGNSIALARHVPVAMALLDGEETQEQFFEKVSAALMSRKKTDWILPTYNGEPNITTPKK